MTAALRCGGLAGIAPETEPSHDPWKAASRASEESRDRAEYVRGSFVDQSSRAEWRCCRVGRKHCLPGVTSGFLKSRSGHVK